MAVHRLVFVGTVHTAPSGPSDLANLLHEIRRRLGRPAFVAVEANREAVVEAEASTETFAAGLIAQQIGIDEVHLANYWEATREASNRGEIPSTEERFKRILDLAGKQPDDGMVRKLVSSEHEMLRNQVEYCPNALEALTALRARGYLIAVSSNCSASAWNAIHGSGIACHVDWLHLSCQVGELKPNERMYSEPLRALRIEPSRSVFVGDGANDELEGAKAAGLATIGVGGSAGRRSADVHIRNLVELPDGLERVLGLRVASRGRS